MQNNIHPLLGKLGRVPDHYEIYPLPDDKKGGETCISIVMTMDDGKVFGFEFGFCVEQITQQEMERFIPHNCSTCCWEFMKKEPERERKVVCPLPPENPGIDCEGWKISRRAMRLAEIAYYKQLHEKYYGTRCISG